MNTEQERTEDSLPRVLVDAESAARHRAAVLARLGCSLLAGYCLLILSSSLLRADETLPPSAPPPATELANANSVALLVQARDALYKLDNPPDGDELGQPKIYFDTAVDCLTSLYQLHGCQWAEPELRQLYARPQAPALRIGHSADGRVLLRVEPLALQNPVFEEYSVLLCTFSSQTARDILDPPGGGAVELSLPDGTWAGANELTPAHPLWSHLLRLVGQFAPPEQLPSGSGLAWKQLYAIPLSDLPFNDCTLSLDWGGYHFELPRWTAQAAGTSNG